MSSRLGGEEGARTRTHTRTQPLHPQPMQTQPPRGKNTDRMGPSAGHKRHNIKDICSKSIYPEHLISKKYIYKQNLQKQKLMMRFWFSDPWMNAAITTCHFFPNNDNILKDTCMTDQSCLYVVAVAHKCSTSILLCGGEMTPATKKRRCLAAPDVLS